VSAAGGLSAPVCAGEIGSGAVSANDVGVDEVRFIEFDGRWWIVHIGLHDPGTVQLAR
jgi:hypothetical protein